MRRKNPYEGWPYEGQRHLDIDRKLPPVSYDEFLFLVARVMPNAGYPMSQPDASGLVFLTSEGVTHDPRYQGLASTIFSLKEKGLLSQHELRLHITPFGLEVLIALSGSGDRAGLFVTAWTMKHGLPKGTSTFGMLFPNEWDKDPNYFPISIPYLMERAGLEWKDPYKGAGHAIRKTSIQWYDFMVEVMGDEHREAVLDFLREAGKEVMRYPDYYDLSALLLDMEEAGRNLPEYKVEDSWAVLSEKLADSEAFTIGVPPQWEHSIYDGSPIWWYVGQFEDVQSSLEDEGLSPTDPATQEDHPSTWTEGQYGFVNYLMAGWDIPESVPVRLVGGEVRFTDAPYHMLDVFDDYFDGEYNPVVSQIEGQVFRAINQRGEIEGSINTPLGTVAWWLRRNYEHTPFIEPAGEPVSILQQREEEAREAMALIEDDNAFQEFMDGYTEAAIEAGFVDIRDPENRVFEPLSERFDVSDIGEDTLSIMRNDAAIFFAEYEGLLVDHAHTAGQDFHYARNHEAFEHNVSLWSFEPHWPLDLAQSINEEAESFGTLMLTSYDGETIVHYVGGAFLSL